MKSVRNVVKMLFSSFLPFVAQPGRAERANRKKRSNDEISSRPGLDGWGKFKIDSTPMSFHCCFDNFPLCEPTQPESVI